MGENPEMVLHQELHFNIDLNHTLICTVNSNNEHFDPWLDFFKFTMKRWNRADSGGNKSTHEVVFVCTCFINCCDNIATRQNCLWITWLLQCCSFRLKLQIPAPRNLFLRNWAELHHVWCFVSMERLGNMPIHTEYSTSLGVMKQNSTTVVRLSSYLCFLQRCHQFFFGAHNLGDGGTIAHPYRCEVPGIPQVQPLISTKPLGKLEFF